MLRGLLLAGLLLGASVPAVAAQDRAQTLADIRQELSFLHVQMQRLRGELNTTGAPQGTAGARGSTLERIDTLEAELRRVISKVEQLEFRVNEIVRDGTNRISDLEFRLVELEGGDTSRLRHGSTLGGDVGALQPLLSGPVASFGGSQSGGGQSGGGQASGGSAMAVGEQGAFEAARTLAASGDHEAAAAALRDFVDTYPGGPLTVEAQYLRGTSLAELGRYRDAARAYLDAFSAEPDGPLAPASLVGLGTSLGELGQRDEACLTLGEVSARFPGDPEVRRAEAGMSLLGCR